jgi:ubiquitin C-terminal hydrolase
MAPFRTGPCDNPIYRLQSAVLHDGTATDGHFYAYAIDVTGAWSRFNDSVVVPTTPEVVVSDGNAYVVYYER